MDVVEYDKPFKTRLTDEMISILKPLTIEEQAKRFEIEYQEIDWDIVYGDRIVNRNEVSYFEPEKFKYARKWVVKDGIIVGMVFSDLDSNMGTSLFSYPFTIYYKWIKNGIGGYHEAIYCKLKWKE